MTLERRTDASGTVVVRLVECPFCGEPVGPRTSRGETRYSGAAAHLRTCRPFYERMGVDPDAPLPATRASPIDPHTHDRL